MKIEGDDDIVVLVSTKQTRDRNPVLRKGPLKGKRVELAPTTGIKALESVAEAFTLEVFGFEPGEYLITHLSSLYDFVGVDDMDAGDMLARVSEEYGLDLANLPGGNLLEIFERVHDQQIRVRKDVRAH